MIRLEVVFPRSCNGGVTSGVTRVLLLIMNPSQRPAIRLRLSPALCRDSALPRACPSREKPSASVVEVRLVDVTSFPAPTGELCLGHILEAADLDVSKVVVLRHTYTTDGLMRPADVTPPELLDYVRRQETGNKLGRTPAPLWLNFMADGGRRSRFSTAYENHGEVPEQRSAGLRYFDLRPSSVLSALSKRLIIEWSQDAVNWAKQGSAAAAFRVVEIADPEVISFPGFDRVLISFNELLAVVDDSRYRAWRTALGAIQGIYLIADTSTGKLYVGKADGSERILGRWTAYAKDGHGGNVAMRDLAQLDASHREHFRFSILRVFGPSVPTAEVDEAEAHYKRAMLTRQWGLNRN